MEKRQRLNQQQLHHHRPLQKLVHQNQYQQQQNQPIPNHRFSKIQLHLICTNPYSQQVRRQKRKKKNKAHWVTYNPLYF